MSFQKKVLDYMKKDAYKPLTIEELTRKLEVSDRRDVKKFHKMLAEMEQAGEIIRTRYGRYGVPEKMNLIVGTLQGHASGFGFVLPDDSSKQDVYVSANNMGGAMHGDRVVARLSLSRGKKREGEIIRVLKRRSSYLVGTYEASRGFGFVVPDDQRISQDIFIQRSDAKGLKSGAKVQVEIIKWPEKRRNPEGNIVSILGYPGDQGLDMLTIIKKHDLPEEFPAEVLAEARAYGSEISKDEIGKRRDLRSLPMVTIDGADAKDLDDAVSLRQIEGDWELGVHIADVGYYVREGTFLDKEAFRRGTSVYMVDRVIPMLPQELSNDLCSLNPKVDRLAMSALMRLDENGEVKKYEFYPSVIKTKERMTYDQIRDILQDGDKKLRERYRELVPMFEDMEKLAIALRNKRIARGSIDFALPEIKVILDEEGRPQELQRRDRSIAESIIEEFMLQCNEVVAKHFNKIKKPFVYRVHERPNEEKITEFRDFVSNLGYPIKGLPEKIDPLVLQQLLGKVSGKPEERVVNTLLLRAMKQARYAPECTPHFGLAAPYYTHFTSPIRRYPDLVIHRLMREYLQQSPNKKRLSKLAKLTEEAADHSSIRERVAMEAERESVDMKKIEFMEGREGETFPAVISGVCSFGIFAELDNLVEGLVHVSSMDDDYYSFHAEKMMLIGERTSSSYRIGQEITVKVKRVSKEDRQIDFVLADGDS